MAIKQVEWKQELNKESGKWWLSALILGVLQGLLAWGSLPLAGNVLGISEMTGSVKFYVFAMFMSIGICFLQGWQELHQKQGDGKRRKGHKLYKFLGMAGLLVGLSVVLWLLYRGNESWGDRFGLLQDTYLLRIDSQVREFELKYRSAVQLQPVLEILLLGLFALVEVIGGRSGRRKLVFLVPVSVVCAGL